MKKKLRLLLFKECHRNCSGCCNKDWDLDSLPVTEGFKDFDEILLTGGEPMLYPELVKDTVRKIRTQSIAKVYMYTAKVDDVKETLDVLDLVDGITLTLHDSTDLPSFVALNSEISIHFVFPKILRLNVFKGVNISGIDTSLWKVKKNIKWIKNCPLPKNEVFMRLPKIKE